MNALVKGWMASGLHVWTEQEGILFPQPGQARYLIGGTTTDNACANTDWGLGVLALAANTGATQVQLVAGTVPTNGQNIGVLLNTGLMFWTTVSGAPVGTVVGLAQALPSAASAGGFAPFYTTRLIRPLRIPKARQLQFQGLNEIPMNEPLSRQGYMDLPNKLTPGSPTQFFYSPQLVSGELYIWPVPSQAVYGIRFTWYRPIYDFTDPSQTADFPQEWILPLTWALAEEMGPEFDVPADRWGMIRTKASEAKEMASCWDRESEDVQFGIDWQRR